MLKNWYGDYMKKTQLKDSLRNISRQKVSFLSIVIIAAMAVMAYTGLNFASEAISGNASRFYDSVKFRDVEIVSSLLVSEEDLKALKEIDGVENAELVWQSSGTLKKGNEDISVSVVSLTKEVNVPSLVSGRLPKSADECLIDFELAGKNDIREGDKITIKDAAYLKGEEFKVCGLSMNADHAVNMMAMPGARYVTVLPDAFDRESLDGCGMKAVAGFKDVIGTNRFGADYKAYTEGVLDKIEALADTQTDRRTDAIMDKYNAQIADGEEQLKEAKTQLDAAKAELDAGKAELDAREQEYADGGKLLSEKEKEISDAEKKLAEARAQLTEGYRSIDDAKNTVRENVKDAIRKGLGQEYVDAVKWGSPTDTFDVDDPNLTATRLYLLQHHYIDLNEPMLGHISFVLSSLLQQGITEEQILAAAEKVYGVIEIFPEEGIIQAVARKITETYNNFDNKYEQFAGAARLWDEKHAEYLAALAQLKDGKAQWNAGRTEYRNARAALDYGWSKYNDGLAQYEAGLNEYNLGLAELEKAKARLSGVDPCQWVVLGPGGNGSYGMIDSSVKNISDMGITFALIFILVGALVIYATIGRIVDEQRKLVGATKALGLYRREIFQKYLMFGVGGTIIGMILGVVGGYFLIQPILTVTYGRFYNFECSHKAFILLMSLIVIVCGIILATVAVWSACSVLLRSSAMNLMQDKAPGTSKKSGKASSKSLYTRLILLNMLTDKKRVAVTIVSIAGCCALLVGGFTMRIAIVQAIDRQFTEITHYDSITIFSDDAAEKQLPVTQTRLESAGADTFALMTADMPFVAAGSIKPGLIYCGDLDAIQSFFAAADGTSGEKIDADAEGIWVFSGLLDKVDFKAGDTFIVYDRNMQPHSAKVAGTFKNYFGREILMNEKTYESIFGEIPQKNTLLTINKNATAESVKRILSSTDGVESTAYSLETHDEYRNLASALDLIALLMVVIAGVMAYFIILNLVTMHVNQKRRELTIMRVNGFTVKEAVGYILRETVVSNIAGIILGLGAGMLLGYRVIMLLEGVGTHYIHEPRPTAMLLAILITIIFSVLVNFLALRKVKYLKLTDIA